MFKLINIPTGEKVSRDYQIKLGGVEAPAYLARVSAMAFDTMWPGHQRPLSQTEEASVLSFIMDEPVQIEIESARSFEEVVIRPLSKNIVPTVNGNTISFTVPACGQYTVELDGWHKPLTIFANPDVDFGVDPGDPDVIYFPAGVHHTGEIKLESNQTLYIDAGAVVYGSVTAILADNVKIVGYGILDGSWEKRTNTTTPVPFDESRCTYTHQFALKDNLPAPGQPPVKGSVLLKDRESFEAYLVETNQLKSCVRLYRCKNCQVTGVTLRDAPTYTVIPAHCDNVVFDNVKLIGHWRYNSDGIDFFNSRNCVVKNSFLRCFDDCIVLKGIVGWDTWNMENILVENCVLWCDWGRNLEIGAETSAPEYKNIVFRNCDCIHLMHIALDIQLCDYAHIHDVIFDDIRVEYTKYDEECTYQVSDDMEFVSKHGIPWLMYAGMSDISYCFCIERVKGKISDITFQNIQVFTDNEEEIPRCELRGFDERSYVENVTFRHITVNGKPFDMAKSLVLTGPVRNVTIEE